MHGLGVGSGFTRARYAHARVIAALGAIREIKKLHI